MKNLRYVCAQPRLLYYVWQVEVMINNFIKNEIKPNNIDVLVVWNPDDDTSKPEVVQEWNKLINNYNEVRFFLYKDTRNDMSYIPSVYFNALKQHIKSHPELKNEVLFLHDSDIIFTKPIDLYPMIHDNIWYLSDTIGYIGSQYILSKGEDVYQDMCKIMDINCLIPKLLNSNSGGAQYIVKNTTYEFWDKVEKDSTKLYKHFCNTEYLHKERKREGHPIQKWTAGMWSLLWNAWLHGNETKVDKRLDFCWATDPIQKWNDTSIFHNAGVTDSSNKQFYKALYMNSYPYNIKLEDFNPEVASYNYVKEIIETSKVSCLC